MRIDIPKLPPTHKEYIPRSSRGLADAMKKVKNAYPEDVPEAIGACWAAYYFIPDEDRDPQLTAELYELTAAYRYSTGGELNLTDEEAFDYYEKALGLLEEDMHLTRARILRSYANDFSKADQHESALTMFKISLDEHAADTKLNAARDSKSTLKAGRHMRITEVYESMALMRAGHSIASTRKVVSDFADNPPSEVARREKLEVLEFVLNNEEFTYHRRRR